MEEPEVWLRGPIEKISPLLQPVAHAIVQAREEVVRSLTDFPIEKLWERPAGVASPGFHLQHLAGVLDRLFTYARGESLTKDQFEYLQREGVAPSGPFSLDEMLGNFKNQIEKCLHQLEKTPEESLLNPVAVGRKKLPSNVLGLLFHAAEHTQRHTGQLIVTVRVLVGGKR